MYPTVNLYNTLTQSIQPIIPVREGEIGIYTCGPTVYRSSHIGNLRIYLMADWLRRVFEYLGYRVTQVKNITDVGHMRQEMLDRGEDKIIAAARAAGKTSREIAEYYTNEFLEGEQKLNILKAHFMPKATDYVRECIELTSTLLQKGYAYERKGNIYFDVSRFHEYGKLSGNRIHGLLKGVRVEVDEEKRAQADFALWKAAEKGREMKWNSPWGEGFPGWHIECSAMSTKILGSNFDIHTGGVDNIFPHHEDEIAQSEAALGRQVVNCWVHGQHLLADSIKMAKSNGNYYTIEELENRGFDPLAFRYMALTAHYRKRLNFTFTSLKAAQRGFTRLRDHARLLQQQDGKLTQSPEVDLWKEKFTKIICKDLDLPHAFELTYKMMGAPLRPEEKLHLLYDFDQVLGLKLKSFVEKHKCPSEYVAKKIEARQSLRKGNQFTEADSIRYELRATGVSLQDTLTGTRIMYQTPVEVTISIPMYSSSKEVPSYLNYPDRHEYTFVIVTRNNLEELVRCIKSIRRWCGGYDYEIVLVDNGSTDQTFTFVDTLEQEHTNLRVIHADHNVGEAGGKNMGLKQALGRYIVFIDTSVEIAGDVLSIIKKAIAQNLVGAVGHKGMCTDNFNDFYDCQGTDVHAVQMYFFAFPREVLKTTGLLNEKFKFYRHLDLYFCFTLRDKGYKIRTLPNLSLQYHRHRDWEELPEDERFKKSRHNFYIFLKKWHHRSDLLALD